MAVGGSPSKLTWNLRIDQWKTGFLYNPVVFRFHVDLPGCKKDNKKHLAVKGKPN